MPGCMPSRVNGAESRASSATNRRSQASASASPAPIAAPETAATVGISRAVMESQSR